MLIWAHPRMRTGHLGNPLESQHRGVFCAPTIVPATFRKLVPATFQRCSGHLFHHPLEQFGFNNLPLLFQAIQLVMDTKQVVYDTRDPPADVWFGGDSHWVRRIIGISPSPHVGSLYNEAI